MNIDKSQLEFGFNTPVLFLIFNRPALTRKVFEQIRKIQPKRLFIAADGPRESNSEDNTKCAETRSIVMEMIDWNCEVQTLFRDKNLGCGKAVSEAITWFFKNVEMGIILEDDILISKSFYSFAGDMLNKYLEDKNILLVSGSNFQLGKWIGDGDYYFSQFPNTWGWATWRDRWKLFDYDFKLSPIDFEKFAEKPGSNSMKKLWIKRVNEIHENRNNIWDYQWFTNILIHDKVSIVPNKNLVKNIGIAVQDATNTHGFSRNYQKISSQELSAPFRAPSRRIVSKNADQRHFRKFFISRPTVINQLRNIAYKLIPAHSYKRIKVLFGRN